MQSVWVVVETAANGPFKVVDLTGRHTADAGFGEALTYLAPTMTGAIVAAVAHAGSIGRRVVAVTRIEREALLVVE